MGIFDLFMPNPSDKASEYLNQIPGQVHDIYDPYVKQGQDAYNQLNPIYGRMGQDPTAFLEQMMKGYAPSRGYQLKRDEALRAAGNTAAAGGMRGSMSDITGQERLASSLMGQDMQQWLNNVMGIQDRGTGGLQNFYNNGFNASNAMAGDLTNALGSSASNAYQGQRNRNQGWSDLLGGALGLGAMGAGSYYGAGAGGAAGGGMGAGGGSMAGGAYGGGMPGYGLGLF